SMKVHDVLTDQNILRDAVGYHDVDHISLQVHDVVVDGIVPLAQKFNYRIASAVIGKEYFDVECLRSHEIPGRIDVISVDGIGIAVEVVFLSVERRPLILAGVIKLQPVEIWFDVMHKKVLKC